MQVITTAQQATQAKTIVDFKATFQHLPTAKICQRLADEKESIATLESIYMTGGALNFFSQTFADAAYKERQRICLLTSALSSILQERGV